MEIIEAHSFTFFQFLLTMALTYDLFSTTVAWQPIFSSALRTHAPASPSPSHGRSRPHRHVDGEPRRAVATDGRPPGGGGEGLLLRRQLGAPCDPTEGDPQSSSGRLVVHRGGRRGRRGETRPVPFEGWKDPDRSPLGRSSVGH